MIVPTTTIGLDMTFQVYKITMKSNLYKVWSLYVLPNVTSVIGIGLERHIYSWSNCFSNCFPSCSHFKLFLFALSRLLFNNTLLVIFGLFQSIFFMLRLWFSFINRCIDDELIPLSKGIGIKRHNDTFLILFLFTFFRNETCNCIN